MSHRGKGAPFAAVLLAPLLLAAAACPGKSEHCTEDSCGASAICYGGRSCEPLTARFLEPAADVATSCVSGLPLRFATGGAVGQISEIALLVDGQVAATGLISMDRYLLVCQNAPEGSFDISIRVTGHGKSFYSAPRRITVDRTPPQIVAWRPDPALHDLPAQSWVEVELSEPIDPASLAAGRFDVWREGSLSAPAAYQLSADGKTVRVDTPPIREALDLVVDFVGQVTDRAGNPAPSLIGRWTQPAPDAVLVYAAGPHPPYLSGVVPVTVSFAGGADRVELLLDAGAFHGLVTVAGPPYVWTADTSLLPEGIFQCSPRVWRGGRAFGGTAATFAIDRTPPAVTYVGPTSRDPLGQLRLGDEMVVNFSEPLDAATATDPAAIQVTDGAGTVIPVSPWFDGVSAFSFFSGAAPWPPVVHVAVGAPLADAAGNPLAPVSATFTSPEWFLLGARTRPAGAQVQLGGVGVTYELLTFRHVTAVWEEADPGAPSGVLASTSWPAPLPPLDASPARPARHPSWTAGGTNPVYAWSEGTSAGPPAIQVAQFDAAFPAQLDRLGGPLGGDATHGADYPRIARSRRAADATPVLTWIQEVDGGTALRTVRWDGAAWAQLGGGPTPGAVALPAAVEVDSALTPVVAWVEPGAAGPGLVYLSRWTAGAWSAPEGPLNADPAQPASAPALALDWQDRPVVAWAEPGGASAAIQVRQWTGSAWAPIDPLVGTGGAAGAPALRVDYANRPVVAFREAGARGLVRVARWEAGAWSWLGASPNEAGGDAGPPVLELDGWQPMVGWTQDGNSARIAVYNR